MKKILSLQKLSLDVNHTWDGSGSRASLLLCGDSSLSVVTCD